jgi:hypothetical protein
MKMILLLSSVQAIVQFHLTNEGHLPAVNHAKKERSVAINNLAAVGHTKKGKSFIVRKGKEI